VLQLQRNPPGGPSSPGWMCVRPASEPVTHLLLMIRQPPAYSSGRRSLRRLPAAVLLLPPPPLLLAHLLLTLPAATQLVRTASAVRPGVPSAGPAPATPCCVAARAALLRLLCPAAAASHVQQQPARQLAGWPGRHWWPARIQRHCRAALYHLPGSDFTRWLAYTPPLTLWLTCAWHCRPQCHCGLSGPDQSLRHAANKAATWPATGLPSGTRMCSVTTPVPAGPAAACVQCPAPCLLH